MTSRDEAQRKADLDWLYGREPDAADRTRILRDAEQAELDKRAARSRRPANPEATGNAPRPAADDQGDHTRVRPRTGSSRPAPTDDPVGRSTRDAGARPRTERPGSERPGTQRPGSDDLSADAGTRRPGRRRPGSRPAGASAVGGNGGPGGPGEGRTRSRRPRGRWSRRRIIAAILALLVAWVVWLVLVPLYAWSSMHQVDATPGGDRPGSQPGTAILLIGSDSRDNLSDAEKAKLRTGTDQGARTDTMMILYVPPSGKSVLVSLPRDSYVAIPGHGHNKINAAYSIGGPKLMMQTVEQDTGVRLDGYMEIGMGGFSDVIDSLGGIRMCLKQPMVDKDSHTNLKAGCQKLTGPQALGYVRMRHADPLGDLGRVQRQRQMLAAVTSKIASPATAINPFRYWSVNMAVRDALSRQGLGVTQLPGISSGLMDIARGKGLQLTVPVANSNYSTPAGDSVLWDKGRATEMFHDIQTGQTGDMTKFAK